MNRIEFVELAKEAGFGSKVIYKDDEQVLCAYHMVHAYSPFGTLIGLPKNAENLEYLESRIKKVTPNSNSKKKLTAGKIRRAEKYIARRYGFFHYYWFLPSMWELI